MAYTKHTWEDGEVITAAKLNNIEDGCGGSGAMIVTTEIVNNQYTLNKTVQEIYDAFLNGIPVYYTFAYGGRNDFTGEIALAPITKIYHYNYGEVIRIAITTSMYVNSISGTSKSNLYKPVTIIFAASGFNQYPVYYTKIESTDASVSDAGGMPI